MSRPHNPTLAQLQPSVQSGLGMSLAGWSPDQPWGAAHGPAEMRPELAAKPECMAKDECRGGSPAGLPSGSNLLPCPGHRAFNWPHYSLALARAPQPGPPSVSVPAAPTLAGTQKQLFVFILFCFMHLKNESSPSPLHQAYIFHTVIRRWQ